jgi:FMN phosphatase YigB (HAD superfamily)
MKHLMAGCATVTLGAIRGVIFDLGHTLMYLDAKWPEVLERGTVDLAAFLDTQDIKLNGRAFANALLEQRSEGFARAKKTLREVTAEESMRRTFACFGIADPGPALVAGAIDAFFAYEKSLWLAYPAALSVLQGLAGCQLRLGLFSNATDERFIQSLVDCIIRPMPTIDSDGCRPRVPGHADHSFRQHGVHFFPDAGIGGRLVLDSVDGMPRNPE